MEEPPAKRTKLLSDDDSDGDSTDGGAAIPASKFKINEDYARRFEHNSKRAELHRLEEKIGSKSAAGQTGDYMTSSSEDEDEDEDGELAQGALDEQYMAALHAIRNKDPKIYDSKATFFNEVDENALENSTGPKAHKPMYLNDYHRENLLRGQGEPEEDAVPTYAQQQEDLKRSVTREMHKAIRKGSDDSEDEEDDEDGFLVAKPRPEGSNGDKMVAATITADDVEAANAAPEAFLNKFLETKAWVRPASDDLHPFESDDEEDEERAEAVEAAYNMRFEDPEKANETLKSHARDAAAKYSVRKESTSKRQRARDVAREQMEAEKQERAQDRARLRKLRIDEAQEKLDRIHEAAGAKPGQIEVADWQQFLTEDWDDDQWEKEMKNRFGDNYYAADSDAGSDDDGPQTKRKPRKPKWEDDIEIGDLVPDHKSDEGKRFSLSEDEAEGGVAIPRNESRKNKKKEREKDKSSKRKQQRHIEQLVDSQLGLDHALNGIDTKGAPLGFRYRETSPAHFGMTARDILMASDSQLNQFAGLKKMAAFRDEEKKQKDHKRLGKKARLRQWRKETFGDARGPQKTLQDLLKEELEGKGADGKIVGRGKDKAEHQKRKRKQSTEVDS